MSSSSHEENMGLLDEKNNSDSDSERSVTDAEPWFEVKVRSSNYSEYLSAVAATWSQLRSAPWRVLLIRVLFFLTPSFLQGRHAREQICPPKLAPTAYLDGMRGLAALFVFFCHYSYQAFTIAKSWGTGEDNYHFLKLPFLRLWYQGPAAVCVFFVISGYALSYRPVKLIRSGALSDFATTMSSLTFRRAIRLYLPTAISTFMIICLLRIGAYEWTREFGNDRKYMKNVVEPHPARMESSYAQFRDWTLHMYNFVHVFGWDKYGGSTSYDVHLWTIPVEFRCSLYLFLTIIGTARLRTSIRFLTVGGMTWFSYCHSRWELCLFLSGMLLAEMDHIRGAHITSPVLPQIEKQPRKSRGWIKSIIWTSVSVLSLYLLSQPDDGGEMAPGWVYLTSLIPEWWSEEKYRYWQSAGAVVFVLAVGHSPAWQRFFNSPVVQYFGKISYALYLMHGPAMHAVGYHWERMAYAITGVEGYWYNAGFFLGAAFAVPTVIWWADVFWRAVDIPTVKFAKWFENKCITKN
ncbi:Acyltransferase 3 [Metarhizium album ARSEF 1941]|uniref:Acyltransferase 3 n=1 Tax=Metarhizium album (strain ARSEF 1941) TaxID=1081103 RepID=A0A0B2WLL7_METAS|nr:Acyltransferase 3 [Metarhizium album ARSEF 1941]KHN96956.1 Acyltransferase 3 [Metarhizium album ARSEF 1941]